jgi:hypothetical protein
VLVVRERLASLEKSALIEQGIALIELISGLPITGDDGLVLGGGAEERVSFQLTLIDDSVVRA